jgi:uncharacterized protein
MTTEPTSYGATPAVPVSGPFVWHDLMTTDAAGSVAFYSALFGWRTESRDMGSAGTYTAILAGDQPFGGMVPFDPRHGIPSHWVSYVAVDDVDATCARTTAAGGRVCIPATDIPNVGRFAMIEDPAGAILSPISLPNGGPRPDPSAAPAPGSAWWHELACPDPDGAAAFYHAVFGWRVQEAPMPDGSTYWLLLRGEAQVGGMFRLALDAPVRPHWTIYVTVADADAAIERAISLGATATTPCMDIPGTGRVAGLVDPHGAAIAVGQTALS